MGIQKPFVVRNGLEVSVDGLVINPPSLNVGIGITNPQYDLDVQGDINYTGTLYNDGVPVSFGGGGDGYWENQASGIYTSRNVAVGTCITLNANSGIVSACGLSIDGILIDSANARQVGLVIATEGQTTFNINYSVGYIDVFLNGSRLASTEYTATNGSTVVLTTPATAGDEIQLVADRTFTITNIANAAGRNVEYFTATTGQTVFYATYVVGFLDVYLNGSKLGAGEFTATDGTTITLTTPATNGDEIEIISFIMSNGNNESLWEQTNSGIITSSNVGIGTTNASSALTVSGNILVSGVVTATSFVGDGSGLTGLPSGGSSSQWETTTAGIHTLSNIGIGTTNPTSSLTVGGDALISGVVTATSFVGDGSGLTNLPFPTRVAISSTTVSMINLDTVSLEMQAYKTYIINSIFIDKPARVRLYTDNTSRATDAGRGVGTDPAPGSGLILEVVSTVSNYTQKVTPFVVGGNLDEPTTNTAYLSITNQSGTTTGIGITVSFLSLDF